MSEFNNSSIFKKIDRIVSPIVLGFSLFFMFVLLYRQATDQGNYNADMAAYIGTILGTEEELSFPYPVMFKMSEFIYHFLGNVELAIVITVTFLNGMALFVTKRIISKQTKSSLLGTIATFCLFFSTMIFSHVFQSMGLPYRYLGVFGPIPWHNPTYAAVRPFMILAFVTGAYTMLHYEEDLKKENFEWDTHKYYIYFCVAMLLVTLTKPAYNLPHMSVVFIVAVYRLLKNRFSTFRQTLLLACTYIPTIVDLLYQYKEVFAGNDYSGVERGMMFDPFGVWLLYSNNIPLSIILAGLFPIVTLLLHRSELVRNAQYRFSWQIYLAGLIMAILLAEKGFRYTDCNFFWGYMSGLFVVFLTSIEQWVLDVKRIISSDVNNKHICIVCVESIFMLLHVICGLRYFMILFNAGNYA